MAKRFLSICALLSMPFFMTSFFAIDVASAEASAKAKAGAPRKSTMANLDFEEWIQQQANQSVTRMLANVSPAGTAAGVVVASPEQKAPNYYYHWVRDAALTMSTVVDLYSLTEGAQKNALQDDLVNYLRFSRGNQLTQTIAGMGEPKFNVDGTAFNLNWCRPQNDGPALRAITLTHFANLLLDQGNEAFVRSEIYDSAIPAKTVVKADLEFVSHHWHETSCDIWEEVSGDHFYTRLVQRRALIEGSALANRMGDKGAAAWYLEQAQALEPEIQKHWDAARGVFIPTLNWQGGIDYKTSGLDGQVILGILHSQGFAFSDPSVQSTLQVITARFQAQYDINRAPGIPGVGIGRYPEDVYDGGQFKGGNPWILITAAFANAHYKAAQELATAGRRKEALDQVTLGDAFLKRIQYHANPDGSLSEQFDRVTGFMTSARDLTWSHAELIQAAWARMAANKSLSKSH
jgi:glucoamylase